MFEVKKEIPVNVKREALVLPRNALLLVVFFCICCGLGYTTLNRYDPGKAAGTSDAAGYYELMIQGPQRPPNVLDQRILIPYLARPIWWLAQGRVGSWDPGWFALLVVNAAFVAATASMTFAMSARYCEGSTAMLGSLLFLLNYGVANLDLAGLVDAGEACFLMALVLSLSTERWWHLPLWGVLGTLSKETFLPLATAMAIGWWIAHYGHPARWGRLLWICGLAAVGFMTVTLVMSAEHGRLYLPWEFAARMSGLPVNVAKSWLIALVRCVANPVFVYTFAWLLPLGVWRLSHFPWAWRVATASGVVAALAMGAYDNAAGNTVRAFFNVAGPMLSVSVAVLLSEIFRAPERHHA